MSMLLNSTVETLQSTLMNQVFTDLRENRPTVVEISVLESFQEQRRCKSMPNMAFKTNPVGDVPETTQFAPSREIKVLTGSSSD